MTTEQIKNYFGDFKEWLTANGYTEGSSERVADWAAELVGDGFISEDEATELVAVADEDPSIYAMEAATSDIPEEPKGEEKPAEEPKSDEPESDESADGASAASLGPAPVATLKARVDAFADKVGEAVKSFYNTSAVLVEDCEGDVIALNHAISTMRDCMEKAEGALKSMKGAMEYQKNEDTMAAISLLADAISELAGDEAEANPEEAGAPSDSLSSEVSAIYNDEPTAPEESPNPVEEPAEV